VLVWKSIFDAKHERGRYYGRVAFVLADDETAARALVPAEALVEFPGHEIVVISVGPSTQTALDAFTRAKAATAEWQRQNRERQVLLCRTCNGTGLSSHGRSS